MARQRTPEKYIGKIFQTNFNGLCKVIRYNGTRDISVEFEDGTIVDTNASALKQGFVKNPNNPRIFGVAINDVNFSIWDGVEVIPEYKAWYGMMRRCYDKKHRERYKYLLESHCCENWLKFSNFYKDFRLMRSSDLYSTGDYELDKDILGNFSGLYSKDTCCIVPKKINAIFSGALHKDYVSDLPIGVSLKRCGVYAATISIDNKRKHLGYKSSPEEAFMLYKQAKESEIKRLANIFKDNLDEVVYEKLINFTLDM